MPSIFLCHSSHDKPFVRKLAAELKREPGVEVWFDEDKLHVGDSFVGRIGEGLEQSDFIGVVISSHALQSVWVKQELHAMLARQLQSGRKVVLPILLEDVPLPELLKDKIYADFRTSAQFEESLQKLLLAMGVRGAVVSTVAPAADRFCPAVPNHLAKAMRDGRVVPFIGAGMSQGATLQDGRHLPGFEGLARDLLAEVRGDWESLPDNQRPDLQVIEQALSVRNHLAAIEQIGLRVHKTDYVRWVRHSLRAVDPKPSLGHTLLNLLPFRFFLTTNYDRVLEQVIDPLPEVLTFKDLAMTDVLLQEQSTRFILKLNGDITRADELALGLLQKDKDLEKLADILFRILSSSTVLFIGCSFNDTEYSKLLQRIVNRCSEVIGPHYALVPEGQQLSPSSLMTARLLNIRFLSYKVDGPEDAEHRAVWQFLTQLKPSTRLDARPGQRSGEFFLLRERPQYLAAQRDLERRARALRYVTPSMMNALVTQEYVDVVCRAGLEQFRKNFDRDFEVWADAVVAGMHERRRGIDEKLAEQCEIRILCELSECEAEATRAETGDAFGIAIRERYKRILELLDPNNADLEIRLMEKPFAARAVRSFASMLAPHATGVDVGLAYAAQANTGGLMINLVETNSRYAKDQLVLFEQEWSNALDERKSRAKLEALFGRWREPQPTLQSVDGIELERFARP